MVRKTDFTECPLCGSTVKREELLETGYCSVCRLKIERLIKELSN